MDKKVSSYIGLAQRANQVAYGIDIISEKKNSVHLVLVDQDAPSKYQEKVMNKNFTFPVLTVDNLKDALHRENVYAIGLLNENLANAIINILR